MKHIYLIVSSFIAGTLTLSGQKANDLISLGLGYSSTNIVFNEAFEPSINIFGQVFNTGKTFAGDGPEFDISKNINDRIYLDLSFRRFPAMKQKPKSTTMKTTTH